MSLCKFVESLFADGRVRVASVFDRNGVLKTPSSSEIDETASLLRVLEIQYRDQLPGKPPELSRPAMVWGAMIAFRACSFLVHHESGEDDVRRALLEPFPEKPAADICYSIDLTLRFLPDCVRIAKAANPSDPLVEILKTVGRTWPLSSVGIAGIGQVDPTPFLNDKCLLKLYVDRIIAANDRLRMDHPRVRDAVRAAIGIHRDLAIELVDVEVGSDSPTKGA